MKLSELAKERRTLTEPVAQNPIPYIGLEHIEQQTLCLNGLGSSDEVVSTKKRFEAGDILFGSLRPYFRKVVKPGFAGVCSTDITVVYPSLPTDADFLFYLMASPDLIAHATNISGGTRMPRANWSVLSQSEWDVPDDSYTRQKIGIILSAYDDLIENNTRRIRILEQIARDLYQEWFVHFRFPGYEKENVSQTELGNIPDTWCVKPIGQVVETLGGGTPSKVVSEYWENGEIVWFVPSDLTASRTMFMDDSGSHISEVGLQKSSARLFPPYSLMMSSRATIGVTAINTSEACTNQGFITCIPAERLSVYYLYFWVEQNLERIEQLATGATFREITKGTFRQLPIIVPDERIASEFSDLITPLGQQLLNLQRRNRVMRETRDLLLPRLISGELDVSNLDVLIEPEVEA